MINVLSNETVNKIAAGEIIERPLNIVKELVENSLDAKSSIIDIEIKKAGKKLIVVSDNGIGMNKKDLSLSVLKHSTSKIKDFNDLFNITSFGFRGEALSSISSISSLVIKTKIKDNSVGWKLLVNYGQNLKILPCACSYGTTVEVEGLFFNVPVRQKFLKTDYTERSRIIKVVEELSLANNLTSFKIMSDNKIVFSVVKTNDIMNRIANIFYEKNLTKIKNKKFYNTKIDLNIYFGNINDYISSNLKKYQYLFVNSRPVNYPKWLNHCVYQSYKGLTPRNEHNHVILIYITINPSDININVHPTKREIKFIDENSIYNIIYKTLRNGLIDCGIDNITNNVNNNFNPYNLNNKLYDKEKLSFLENSFNFNNIEQNYTFSENKDNIFYFDKNEFKYKEFFCDNIKILGQIFKTYIVVEKDTDLYIFDQHAVAERIKYETYCKQFKNNMIKTQQMLIPESFDLPSSSSEILKFNICFFNDIGIVIENFGDNFFRIIAFPELFNSVSIKKIIKNVINDIECLKKEILEPEKKKYYIIRSACRTSIQSGDSITFLESKKLIYDLFKCKIPFTCPHGRPTLYKISQSILEKIFKRK
jgi:DNA mismatch repair protein MutL